LTSPLGRLAWAAAILALSGTTASAADPPALTPADRQAVLGVLSAEATAGSQDDSALLAAVRRRAATELGLRLIPIQVDSLWSFAPPPHQLDAEIRAALDQGRLAAWLQSLTPTAPRYRALAAARQAYAGVVAAGGWGLLPDGPARRMGDVGPDVAALRVRLAVEDGPAADTATPEVFDLFLRQSLMAFQARHGLASDGRLTAETRAELNVPADQRLAQIDANLERWRWLPPLPADRIEVDIAGQSATLYRQDSPQLTMRIIVGDLKHKSPMFASRLEAVVFNPPWNVPATIAAQEILPKEHAHPGYLAANDFQFVDGALQQKPGPKNALGRLKFDFPSPYGVYLHDTPSHAAFARANRALSHGCIRLEKPRDLAAAVLPAGAWPTAAIDAAIATGVTQRVAVARQLPIYVLYWTAVAAPDGGLEFRRDRYGWDDELTRALADLVPVPVAEGPRPATECAAAKAPQPVL